MKVAFVGCTHGALDLIYQNIQFLEEKNDYKVDLVVCCGDFEACRNLTDLDSMSVPAKYKELKDFEKYYRGFSKAPILTLVIGGNHEAATHMWELFYGGWLAENIYFLGYSGCVNFGGLKIAGISGIYSKKDYKSGHYERLPYNDNAKKSNYHIRPYECWKLSQLKNSSTINVMLSHDWPTRVSEYGDQANLIKTKPWFKEDIDRGQLGSEPGRELLNILQPNYWVSGHLHCFFEAEKTFISDGVEKTTKFMALDKPLPKRFFAKKNKRKYLHVLDINPENPNEENEKVLKYDLDWLAITKATFDKQAFTASKNIRVMHPKQNITADIEACKIELQNKVDSNPDLLTIPLNFEKTAPTTDSPIGDWKPMVDFCYNNQTFEFLDLLELPQFFLSEEKPKPTNRNRIQH